MDKILEHVEAKDIVANRAPGRKGLAEQSRLGNIRDTVTGHYVPGHDSTVKDWSSARRALLRSAKRRDPQGIKRLDMMADKVLDMAIAGNMQAIIFVVEKLDGKGVQPIAIDQNITVSSIGEAHLHALQRLTDAVTRHDQAKTIEHSEPDHLDTDHSDKDSG